jgi:valyl-tRNA synthetase
MGRDAFLERAWAYKADKGGQIVDQIRRLGASADWTREKFTLDPKVRIK